MKIDEIRLEMAGDEASEGFAKFQRGVTRLSTAAARSGGAAQLLDWLGSSENRWKRFET